MNKHWNLSEAAKKCQARTASKIFYNIFIFDLTPILKSLKFAYNPMIYIHCSMAIHTLELGLPVALIL